MHTNVRSAEPTSSGRPCRASPAQSAIAIACAVAVALAGCATASQDIATAYVTPLPYQGYDCAQLAAESQRIQQRVVELGGRLDQAAANDKAILGVGLILFWPALFALGGTKQQEAEYAQLKGEFDAVQQVAIAKQCQGVVVVSRPIEAAVIQAPAAAGAVMAAPAPTAGQGLAGLRWWVRDTDSMTGLVAGESLVVIDSVSERGTVLNGGATVLDARGQVVSGSLMLPHLAGLGGGRLGPGTRTSATYLPNGAAPATLSVNVMRMETMRVADREIIVARCKVSGNAPRSQIAPLSRSWDGAVISGEITVEPQTGLTLAATVKSAHPYYSLNRRILAPGER